MHLIFLRLSLSFFRMDFVSFQFKDEHFIDGELANAERIPHRCPVCMDIQVEPYASRCGHVVCHHCVVNGSAVELTYKSQLMDLQTCFYCHGSNPLWAPAHSVPFQIKALRVRCSRAPECDWKGTLADYGEHVTSKCPKLTFQCENGCGKTISKAEEKDHMASTEFALLHMKHFETLGREAVEMAKDAVLKWSTSVEESKKLKQEAEEDKKKIRSLKRELKSCKRKREEEEDTDEKKQAEEKHELEVEVAAMTIPKGAEVGSKAKCLQCHKWLVCKKSTTVRNPNRKFWSHDRNVQGSCTKFVWDDEL